MNHLKNKEAVSEATKTSKELNNTSQRFVSQCSIDLSSSNQLMLGRIRDKQNSENSSKGKGTVCTMTSLTGNMTPENNLGRDKQIIEVKRNRFLSDDLTLSVDQERSSKFELKPSFTNKLDQAPMTNGRNSLPMSARQSLAIAVQEVRQSFVSDSKKHGKGVMIMVFSTMVLLNFGCLYVYDFPQLFTDTLIQDFGISTYQISWLYSIYSIPNFVFAPIGSMIISRTGLGIGSILVTGLAMFSMLVLYLGIDTKSYVILIIARGLFGIGAETLIICQTTIAEKWFTGKFLSIAIGFNNVISLIGAALAAFLGPLLFVSFGSLKVPVIAGIIACGLSVTCGVLYWITEKKNTPKTAVGIGASSHGGGTSGFTISHSKHFKKIFWLLTLCFTFISMAYYQFTNFLTDFLVHRFNYKYIEATNMFTLIPIVIMISIPIISPIVTIKGRKAHALLTVSILAVITYYWMYTMPAVPSFKVTFCLILTAFWFSIYSSVIWSSFTLVVPVQGTGMALAIACTIQNILMTLLPMVFGSINTSRSVESYNTSLLLLMALSICGLFASLALVHEDNKCGGVLYLPENDIQVLKSKQRLGDEMNLILDKEHSLKSLKSNSKGIELKLLNDELEA